MPHAPTLCLDDPGGHEHVFGALSVEPIVPIRGGVVEGHHVRHLLKHGDGRREPTLPPRERRSYGTSVTFSFTVKPPLKDTPKEDNLSTKARTKGWRFQHAS